MLLLPPPRRYSPGSYLKLSRTWKDGDVIEVSFPMHLWTEPLNDYHAIHNATLAFMYVGNTGHTRSGASRHSRQAGSAFSTTLRAIQRQRP